MYSIGVNFDLTYITAGIVDENGSIFYKESLPTLKYRKPEEIVKDIAKLCKRIVDKKGLSMETDIEKIGIGCYGMVDAENGVIIYSSAFGFKNVPVTQIIQSIIKNIPVKCENDANCYALAESRLGATKGYSNSIIVTIGNVISGGILINNAIYSGKFYGAGEFGHHVIIADGENCECGRRGCWVEYVSQKSLVREAKVTAVRHPESLLYKMVNGDIRLMNFLTPFEAAEKGDLCAKELVDKYCHLIAIGLLNIVNILQPEAIAIGGRMRKVGNYFIDDVSKIVNDYSFGHLENEKKTRVVLTEMDYDAVIIGATMI